MSEDEIVRFWKDPDGRAGSFDEAAHPAGSIDLGMAGAAGAHAATTEKLFSLGCCGGLTNPVGCGSVTFASVCLPSFSGSPIECQVTASYCV